MDKVTELVYVCDADLKDNEMRGIKVEYSHSVSGKKHQWILIVKQKGNYYALDAACAHSGYPLHKGSLDADGVVTCGLHYAKFDCRTGQVVSDPAICENQDIFEIQINDGKIYWVREIN